MATFWSDLPEKIDAAYENPLEEKTVFFAGTVGQRRPCSTVKSHYLHSDVACAIRFPLTQDIAYKRMVEITLIHLLLLEVDSEI